MLRDANGLTVPALGLGTWRMGERAGQRQAEISAIRAGIERGLTLIDTAEMYGNGGAEELVGQAIAGHRDGLTLVSKVLPSNASYSGVLKACDRSRRRLGVDHIDVYLLHWASATPLAETIDAFETLRDQGAIGAWGVSNFDAEQMSQLLSGDLPGRCATNQVYYSLGARGIEYDLLPAMQAATPPMPLMAYCPLDQGELAWHEDLVPIAERHGASCAQVALAWLLSRPDVIVIPKSSSVQRMEENAGALQLRLTGQDIAELDRAFPPPSGPGPLQIV